MIDRSRLHVSAVVVLLLGLAVVCASRAPVAGADATTVSHDALRTGWDPNEPNLNGATVGASDFGQLFATQLDGQVYAQPVIAKNTVLVTTENDKVYGLDPGSGAVRWTRDVGPAWPVSAIGCGDLVPNIGSTSTPIVDTTTGTAYFTTKVNNGPDVQHPHWYLHAIDITIGAERSGFPTQIQGKPSNDAVNPFNAFTAMQRPGLLLLGGVVYAGFASHCDHGPYVGYVVGVNASTGVQTTMWSTEGGSSRDGAGVWQSGGGLVSDGAGRIIVATGNGVSPAPGPGSSPPATLAESVVRLAVNSDGSLTAKDFFSPVNNTALDRDDADLGSGGPMAIPDGYGTTAHPHLLVEAGKDGRVFLLDRDHLGGTGQGAGGTDGVLQISGPFNGVWGHPAFWGGDKGYVYLIENGGPMRAYSVGVAGNGSPTLAAAGASASTWGYTSGSPIVTSDGTKSGSALVWAVYSGGPTGTGGQLRAYDPVPSNGTMTLRYSAPIGTASKFAVPATDSGRVYVGTRDGKILAFGRPVGAALNAPPTDFGAVDVGQSRSLNVTVTATRTVTVRSVSAAAPFAVTKPALPVTLTAGQTLTVAARFAPTTTGVQSGTLDFDTDAGTLSFDLHGRGTAPGLGATPTSLAYGDVPVGGQVTQSVSITNTSQVDEQITGTTATSAPFRTSGLPATGATLPAGASVSVQVTFAPTTAGSYASSLVVTSNTGKVTVPVTGTGVSGNAHLTITPTSISFPGTRVGNSVSRTFDLTNTGNLVVTITKAAPPSAPFIVTNPVAEGQQLAPGQVIHQSVAFSPKTVGSFSGTYQITADDGQGAQAVALTGRGLKPLQTLPAPAAGGWQLNGSAKQTGADTVLTDAAPSEAGDAVYPTPVKTNSMHATFTVQIGGGSGADGLTFALLDPTSSRPTSLGNGGASLGFAGLRGIAVALDTYQNPGDPAANFVGIVVADASSPTDHVSYTAIHKLTAPLTSGTHSVDVTVTATSVKATIDGTATVRATASIPATAYVAFTAGTGGLTDVHTVRNVVIGVAT